MASFIRLILVNEQNLQRTCLKKVLGEVIDLKVIEEARECTELLDKLEQEVPDIILMDMIKLDLMDQLKIKRVKDRFPKPKVIISCPNDKLQAVEKHGFPGADALISVNTDLKSLVSTIKSVHFENNSHHSILKNTASGTDHTRDIFSAREKEVLLLIFEGKSNKQIADSLNIIPRTVEFHKTNIFRKAGVSSNSELILYIMKHNIFKANDRL